MTDFFELQISSRRRTLLLVPLYILAVLFIITCLYVIAMFFVNGWFQTRTMFVEEPFVYWHAGVFWGVSTVVAVIMALGTIYHIAVVRKGGEALAARLGGTPVHPATEEPGARRLLNVVEEMSIASGVPVPRVYVLYGEDRINAFAAGQTDKDAVVAVTKGALDKLTRDELQGVVAHEFSHILNGDMRMNLRLTGVVNGLGSVHIIGRVLAETTESPVTVIAGIVVFAIGALGAFFGELIRLAVSRQREFLADASAVQFTRNPEGLAGALKKIGTEGVGSSLGNVHAAEVNHFFFAEGVSGLRIFDFLSPHPPLIDRIARLLPGSRIELQGTAMLYPSTAITSQEPVGAVFAGGGGVMGGEAGQSDMVRALMTSIASPRPATLTVAAQVISEVPPEIDAAAREPLSATVLVYCLLLHEEPKVREAQLAGLGDKVEGHAMIGSLLPPVQALGRQYKLAVLNLALGPLGSLSPRQFGVFRDNVNRLIRADSGVSLFEYVTRVLVLRSLEGRILGRQRAGVVKYRTLESVKGECVELISALAATGASGGRSVAADAFAAGMRELGLVTGRLMRQDYQVDFTRLDIALRNIAMASWALKRKVLRAAVAAVTADREVSIEELELLRAVSAALDCPMPPLLGKA